MKTPRRSIIAAVAVVTLGATGISGCSTGRTERGAILGAAGGAAVGAVIGKQVGSTAKGAVLGAAVGGAAGAVIGRQMEKQAEELREEIPGATVQQVGEGLVVTFDSGLLFPYNSTDLLPAGRDNLRNLAESLREYPDTEVLIVGHADATGSDAYNQRLSQQRADAAANILASYGVDRTRVRTAGRGESEPIATNETEEGRAENRRVEIAIFASEEYRQRVLRGQAGE